MHRYSFGFDNWHKQMIVTSAHEAEVWTSRRERERWFVKSGIWTRQDQLWGRHAEVREDDLTDLYLTVPARGRDYPFKAGLTSPSQSWISCMTQGWADKHSRWMYGGSSAQSPKMHALHKASGVRSDTDTRIRIQFFRNETNLCAPIHFFSPRLARLLDDGLRVWYKTIRSQSFCYLETNTALDTSLQEYMYSADDVRRCWLFDACHSIVDRTSRVKVSGPVLWRQQQE